MIVGATWLKDHNPSIDWTTGQLTFNRCPSSCGGSSKLTENLNKLIDESQLVSEAEQMIEEVRHEIFAFETNATRLAAEALKSKKVLTLDDILQGPYHDFYDVFSDKGFHTGGKDTWDQ